VTDTNQNYIFLPTVSVDGKYQIHSKFI